jgi:Uma2 family endonuclease
MKMLHTLRNSPEDTGYIGTGEKDIVSEDGRFVSEEEYWEKYYDDPDFIYEWKNGRLEVRPMSDVKGSKMYRWFSGILESYFSTYPAGTIISLDIGFRLELPGETVVRIPDLSVVLNGNPVTISDNDSRYEGIFDLCVESLSRSARKYITRDTVHKKKEYAGGGVKEYYILDAARKETAFYRLGKKGKYVKIKPEKGIVRSEVLKGFHFEIKDLYKQPSLEKLSEKETYQNYVLPFYNKAKLRAEQAELKAQSEKMRAESEKHRAEDAEKRFLETARNMLENGLDIARIIKYTGLSADELAELSEKKSLTKQGIPIL